MELKGLGKAGVIEDVSFALHKGEVLGMTGLIGAGRTETAHMLFGLDTFETGQLLLEGKVCASSPRMMPWPQAWPSFRKTARNRALFPRWAWASISPSAYWSSSCISRVWTTQRKAALIDHFFQALKIKAYSPSSLSATSAAAISKGHHRPLAGGQTQGTDSGRADPWH